MKTNAVLATKSNERIEVEKVVVDVNIARGYLVVNIKNKTYSYVLPHIYDDKPIYYKINMIQSIDKNYKKPCNESIERYLIVFIKPLRIWQRKRLKESLALVNFR